MNIKICSRLKNWCYKTEIRRNINGTNSHVFFQLENLIIYKLFHIFSVLNIIKPLDYKIRKAKLDQKILHFRTRSRAIQTWMQCCTWVAFRVAQPIFNRFYYPKRASTTSIDSIFISMMWSNQINVIA